MKLSVSWLLVLAACGADARSTPIGHAGGEPVIGNTADATPRADTRARPTGKPVALTASMLLDAAQIADITSYRGSFTVGPLEDLEEAAPGYTSQHFRANGEPEAFDVAVRLWQFPGESAAATHFDELAADLPRVSRTNELATRSFRAAEGQIWGVGFIDEPRRLVVLLTCGDQQCASMDTAVALARWLDDRVQELWP